MANMKQKPATTRSARRNRYVAAIDPLREMFSCTAAQVAGQVQSALGEREALRKRALELSDKLEELQKKAAGLEAEKVKSEITLSELRLQVNVLEQGLQDQISQVSMLEQTLKGLSSETPVKKEETP